MVQVVDVALLYETYYRKKKENTILSDNELKELQLFLKNAEQSDLESSIKMKFSSMTELISEMNQNRKSFPGSFFLKETK